ncbi:hypothetical protein [Actinocorallia herbida]|nr:hypothetical protein [Actinocorallia herbida]
MKGGGQIALSVLFGYLLGRSHKARTAAMLALMVAAGRSSGDIAEMLRRAGFDKVLTDLRGQLAETGKGIAEKAGTAGTGSLSELADSLLGSRDSGSADREESDKAAQSDRAEQSGKARRPSGARHRDEDRDEYEQGYDDEYEDYAESEEYPDEEEPARGAPSRAAEVGRRDARRAAASRKTTAAR